MSDFFATSIPTPKPVLLDEDTRKTLLTHLLAQELRANHLRLRVAINRGETYWQRDHLLRTLTARVDPPRDVAGALSRLRGES